MVIFKQVYFLFFCVWDVQVPTHKNVTPQRASFISSSFPCYSIYRKLLYLKLVLLKMISIQICSWQTDQPFKNSSSCRAVYIAGRLYKRAPWEGQIPAPHPTGDRWLWDMMARPVKEPALSWTATIKRHTLPVGLASGKSLTI